MRLSLRAKLAFIVGAATAAFLLLMAVNWFLSAETLRQTSAIQDHYIPLVELGYRLETKFEGISLGFRDAVAAQDLTNLSAVSLMKQDLIRELELASQIVGPVELENLRTAIEEYFAIADDTSTRLIKGETGLQIVEAMTVLQAKRGLAETAMKKVATFDRRRLTETFASIAQTQQSNSRVRLWVSISCIAFIFLVSLFMGRALMANLGEISHGLNRFGAGDFKEPIRVYGNDELSELGRQVNMMANRIQSLVKELESFSYSVAHDLRAPLRSVLGFSAALLEDEGHTLSKSGHASLARITAAAKRMGQMVDGLLSLSRLNRAAIAKQRVSLSKLVSRIIQELRSNEPNRNVTLSTKENIFASGDPKLLDIVFSNLLGNAWKFTRRRADSQIQFGSEELSGMVTYFIRDNGAGFDMRYSDKLFGTFQRLHNESEFEGHGIGLATVKSIVERHGGRIWAESEPDKGATFYFTLS